MPNFVKNAMNQIMFPMVDRTDFASIESGITASDFNSAATKKIFGVNHGTSTAFTSATISKAATLVRSGIFQQTLKAAECNYDYLIVSFRHPSCADQILIFQPAEIDPSDTYSLLSDFLSDFQSRVPKRVATDSQLSDLVSDLRSYLVGMSGMLSDTYSNLSDLKSDFQSRVPKAVATNSQVSDLVSDLLSYLTGISGTLSDVRSHVSDLQSDFQSRVPKRVATDSYLSDVHSDLRSQIGGITASVSASDISDIASAVDVILASRLSDILSAAVQVNSRALVIQSRVSDVESALDSQFAYESNALSDLLSYLTGISAALSDTYSSLSDLQSDFQSRVPKRVATDSYLSDVHSDLRSQIGGITASVSVSDISDIASAVRAILVSDLSDILSAAVQTNSRALVIQSHASNIYSLLSDVQSDFQSRVPKEVSSKSLLSDVNSDLASKIGGITASVSASDISDIASAVRAILVSDLSDILSAAVQTNSRALVIQSHASNIYSLLSDVQSDFQSRVPKLVATNSQLSDLVSDLLSYLTGISGTLSDVRSHVSDLQSDFQSRVPKRVATDSQLSDVSSDIRSLIVLGVNLTASDMSDLRSAIAGITLTVSASDISDIASAVRAGMVSDLSDILSAAQQTNSRALVIQSHASNIYSLLSDVQSDFQSRVPKEVSSKSLLSDVNSDLASKIGGITVNLTASNISDIASAVIAAGAGVNPSDISDILSGVRRAYGLGSLTCTLTVEDNGNKLDGVDVWVTSDLAGTNIVARNYTNSLGVVTFYLDAGTYYVWKALSGYTFTNPEAITVS